MVEPVSGEIRVKIEAEEGIGVEAGPRAARRMPSADTPAQKQMATNMGGMAKGLGRFIPFMMGVAGIAGLLKLSKVFSSTMQAIMDILSAIVDVFLMPFMPIFVAILEAIAPLIPKLAEFAHKIASPLIEALLPVLKFILDNLIKYSDLILTFVEKIVLFPIAQLVTVLTAIEGLIGGVKTFLGEAKATIAEGPRSIAEAVLPTIIPGMLPMKIGEFIGRQILGRQLGAYNVPKTGLAMLHRGEEVVPRGGRGIDRRVSEEVVSGGNRGVGRAIYIDNLNLNVEMLPTADIDTLSRDLGRRFVEEISDLIRRS